MQSHSSARLNHQAGIAIGPILFVVAILAILATAIAAGSSTFATNASQETNRTNAGSMLQIGQTLKLGVDRVIGLGTTINNVVINDANVSNQVDLFSATGGGLVPPSTALAAAPATDTWIYTWGAVTNIGTSSLERIALLKVNTGVCDQINRVGANYTTTIVGADLGATTNTVNFSAWPAAMAGKLAGCVNNTNATGTIAGTYFFQVLAAQ